MFSFSLLGQREDYNWLFGRNTHEDSLHAISRIDFITNPANIVYENKFIGFEGTNVSISDRESGELLLFSNGVHIYNNNFEIIENGDEFQDSDTYDNGFEGNQSALLLPSPLKNNEYYFISGEEVFFDEGGWLAAGLSPLHYSTISKDLLSEDFFVEEKEIIMNLDTTWRGSLTATQHANGRDWWVVAPKHQKAAYYIYLLSPEGIELNSYQEIGNFVRPGLGNDLFSPDGNWYAKYQWTGIIGIQTDIAIDIMQFDRCEGVFSNNIQIIYEEIGQRGSAAFSPNSRFLYIAIRDKIYQFDLYADDIPASRLTVAENDGFLDENGQLVMFYRMQLAPDNKIYISSQWGGKRYLHVIDQPDSLGMACNVLQREILLPTLHHSSMPYMPNFRLGALEGSPCDSIISSVETPKEVLDEIKIYPNPTENILHLDFPNPLKEVAQFTLFDNIGQAVFGKKIKRGEVSQTFYLEELPKGIYFYKIETDERQWQSGKVVVF
jgi:hypothetical protein